MVQARGNRFPWWTADQGFVERAELGCRVVQTDRREPHGVKRQGRRVPHFTVIFLFIILCQGRVHGIEKILDRLQGRPPRKVPYLHQSRFHHSADNLKHDRHFGPVQETLPPPSSPVHVLSVAQGGNNAPSTLDSSPEGSPKVSPKESTSEIVRIYNSINSDLRGL